MSEVRRSLVPGIFFTRLGRMNRCVVKGAGEIRVYGKSNAWVDPRFEEPSRKFPC